MLYYMVYVFVLYTYMYIYVHIKCNLHSNRLGLSIFDALVPIINLSRMDGIYIYTSSSK